MSSDFSQRPDGQDQGPQAARPFSGAQVALPISSVTFTYDVGPPTRPFAFEHDEQRRLFALAGPEGETQRFRDNPTRYLVVEPDPETGAMRPVAKHGRPVFMYLCREEREG